MRALLRDLDASGVAAEKIERFLDSELEAGGATVRDQIAADMANQLLAALGRQPSQTAAGTKVLRERGDWRNLDRRPEEDS
jgi:hypothetical protein